MGLSIVPGFRFPSPAHELWAALSLVAAGPVERRSTATAAAAGLSPVSAWALIQLEPGKLMSQKELAARLHCAPSTVVDPTDRLEARGLVVRQCHPTDRRVNVLVVTEEGKRVRARLIAGLFAPPEPLRRLAPADQVKLRDLLLGLLATDGSPASAGRRRPRR